MDEYRRLAMRRAHAKHGWFCSCGKIVHGNGAEHAHRAMHERKQDGHRYLREDAWKLAWRRGSDGAVRPIASEPQHDAKP